HDAEDAFQATFLVLARKAESIRRATAVASWLHGVAYRIALRARRDALRRRLREEKAPLPSEGSSSEAALRELQALLDDEVSRLPEKLRAPFVLCVLDGRSIAEAAALLGWKAGTVSGRLSRARQELRRRLARRGVGLGAALVATEVCRGAAPPPALARATIEGPVVGVSPAVAALAGGVIGTMFVTRSKTVVALLLALGLLAAGTGILANPGDSPRQGERPTAKVPPPAQEKKPAAQDGKMITIAVSGRVLAPDGKPVAKARLYWPRLLKEDPQAPEDVEVAQHGTTGADGRFRVELQHSRLHRRQPMPLLA